MLTLRHQFILPVVAAFVLSCSSSTVSHRDVKEWSAVAIVDGNNEAAQNMVRSTLKRHNIVCFMEGSLGYAVKVPKDRLKEAKHALLEDPNLRRPWLIILEDGKIPDGALPKSNSVPEK